MKRLLSIILLSVKLRKLWIITETFLECYIFVGRKAYEMAKKLNPKYMGK